MLPVVAPQLLINSTINDGDIVCPGQVITFTCETRDSGVLVWISDDYIGEGSQLEFAEINDLPLVLRSSINSETVATFITNANINGTLVLVSQLNITVSEAFLNPSVSCIHVRGGMTKTINFRLLGMYIIIIIVCMCAMKF